MGRLLKLVRVPLRAQLQGKYSLTGRYEDLETNSSNEYILKGSLFGLRYLDKTTEKIYRFLPIPYPPFAKVPGSKRRLYASWFHWTLSSDRRSSIRDIKAQAIEMSDDGGLHDK